MSKKDIARLVHSMQLARRFNIDKDLYGAELEGWRRSVWYLADEIDLHTPRFNKEQFLKDCGYYSKESV